MSTTNVLLIAVLGVLGWMVLKPMIMGQSQASSQTTTSTGSGGSAGAGQQHPNIWENILGTINDIFAAAQKVSQNSPQTT